MNRKAFTILVALVGMSLLISGCVAAAAAGAAAGAGGYAWSKGKLSFTTAHSVTECHKATISSLSELGIPITGDTTDGLAGRVFGETATGDSVTVDLEPQARNVTKIDIRVGFWGEELKSRRIADGIKRHLR